ncbi:MAG: hypothetical protein HYX41_08020 [Bdellovibrio sp.]|nr:hypothetical protein [Bdellovibrio sp.]
MFAAQVRVFSDCVGSPGISDALSFLTGTVNASTGESYFEFLIKLAQQSVSNPVDPKAAFAPADIRFFMNRWNETYDDGTLFRAMNAVPFWIGQPAADWKSSTSILSPLFETVRFIFDDIGGRSQRTRVVLSQIMRLAGKLLRDDHMPQWIADILTVKSQLDTPLPPDPAPVDYAVFPPDDVIADWVRFKECHRLPNPTHQMIQDRVQEIKAETSLAVTNWDLKAKNQGLVRRTAWSQQDLLRQSPNGRVGDLYVQLEPILRNLTTDSEPGHNILNEQLKFVREEGADRLLKFLYPRALDYRLITQIFPGEKYPRVMLVNTLDLFELVLTFTDMEGMLPRRNLALEYLMRLAYAWGDEPEAVWATKEIPDAWKIPIPGSYPQKLRPMTVLEAVHDILNRSNFAENLSSLSKLVGITKLPSCNKNEYEPDPQGGWFFGLPQWFDPEKARRLYNIWQVAIVLLENAPGSGIGYQIENQPVANGILNDGGLKVLRDQFHSLLLSTPKAFRNSDPHPGGFDSFHQGGQYDRNNLSIVLRAVQMGAFRQIGKMLRTFAPESDDAYRDFKTDLSNIGRTQLYSQKVRYVPGIRPQAATLMPKDEALMDFVQGVVRLSSTDNVSPLLKALMSTGPNRELMWTFMSELFDAIDEDKPQLAAAKAKQVLANLKKEAFYGLGAITRLQPWDPVANAPENAGEVDLIHLVAFDALQVLKNHGQWLYENPQAFKSLFNLESAPRMIQNFYGVDWQDPLRSDMVDLVGRLWTNYPDRTSPMLSGMELLKPFIENEKARQNFFKIESRIDEVLQNPAYQALNLGPVSDGVMDFLIQRGNFTSPDSIAASNRVRDWAAFQLETGNLTQMLDWINDKPDETYRLLLTLSESMGAGADGRLKEFFKMIKAGLSGPKH